MKKIFLLFAIAFIVCNTAVAQDAPDEYTVFEVASNISAPVKVETDAGTFAVNKTLRLEGDIKVYAAYDSQGRKIMCDGHKGIDRKKNANVNYVIYIYIDSRLWNMCWEAIQIVTAAIITIVVQAVLN